MRTRSFLVLTLWVFVPVLSFLVRPAQAQQLPSMNEVPWVGFFSGYQRRGFEFGINNEGQCELYLTKRGKKERASHSRTVRIYTEILVVHDDGKKFIKRMQEQGLATEDKEGMRHKKVTFTMLSTGNAKVEVTVKYDRNRIIMDGRVLDRGTLKKGKLFLVFKCVMPSMYSMSASTDQEKMKARMRKDRIKLFRAGETKAVNLKTYLMVDFQNEDVARGGVTKMISAIDGQEGKDFIFTTVSGQGVLQIENRFKNKKAMPWKGYLVKWMREMGDEEQAAFVMEVK